MEALRTEDLRLVLDSVYQLGLVSTMEALPLAVARITFDLVPCHHAGWIVLDFATGQMGGLHWPNDLGHLFSHLPPDLTKVPLVPVAALAPTTTVIRLSDYVTRRELHNTPVYIELYRSIGLEYQMVVPLSFGGPSTSGLRGKRAESLTVARHDTDFTDRERGMLEEFGRHVRNAARRLRSAGSAPTAETAEIIGLTSRQGESLIAISDGATVRMAAKTLGVTPKTLENHLQAAYARLGVSNRTAALARLRTAHSSDFGLGEIPY